MQVKRTLVNKSNLHEVVFLLLILVGMSACGVVAGTPEGIKALGDSLNGAIRTGKESPESNSEYFAHRGTQEKEHTARKGQAQGFWQRLAN